MRYLSTAIRIAPVRLPVLRQSGQILYLIAWLTVALMWPIITGE